MSSAIEKFLYGEMGVQGLTEFTVLADVIRLRLVPWDGPPIETLAVFREARLTTAVTYSDDPRDLDMPWDVIHFDSHERGNGRWEFVVHCDGIEFSFESTWPEVTRKET